MFKKILYISGKPGLFKVLSTTPKLSIVESLATGQRGPAFSSQGLSYVYSMTLFTTGEPMPLGEALNAICIKQKALPLSFNPSTAAPDVLFAYLAEVIPTYDKDRVNHSHARKLFTWYNILVTAGITDFIEAESESK
jgi:hypothetical protein